MPFGLNELVIDKEKPIEPMPGFKFGCDPELFIVSPEGDLVGAEQIGIPGTKSEPYKVPGGAVQVDGMAAEFNIDPVDSWAQFDSNIRMVTKAMSRMLPKGYYLIDSPAVIFPQKVWDAATEKNKELGCSPDYNAWTGSSNPPPHNSDKPTLRTAAGHLHIGWTEDASMSDESHLNNCRDLVKQLDYYLGGWSLQEDQDPTRRLLYGKAGAMRFKDYGVEYRVLSNFWVMHRHNRLQVWNRMQKAIWDMRTSFFPALAEGDELKSFEFNNKLIESINTSTRNELLEKQFSFPLLTTKD